MTVSKVKMSARIGRLDDENMLRLNQAVPDFLGLVGLAPNRAGAMTRNDDEHAADHAGIRTTPQRSLEIGFAPAETSEPSYGFAFNARPWRAGLDFAFASRLASA